MGVSGQRSGLPPHAAPDAPDDNAPGDDAVWGQAGDGGARHAMERALLAARSGDDLAFGLLFRSAQPAILRYLRVLVGADAEDVASEVWLQIARDYCSFSGTWDGFRGWAVTIARHRAIDHIRRQKRRSEVAVPVEQLLDFPAAGSTEGAAVEALSTEVALALIAKLPREQAEAIMLRVVVGLDAATAGQILGRRPGAVRTAAHRGLRKLDQWFCEDTERLLDRVTGTQ